VPLLRKRPENVLGHVLPEPRLTPVGVLLIAAWVSVPVLVLGSLLDLAVQWAFGVCVGLWCVL
jgi:hypothetical protein